jgi:hypothetical protein
MVSSGMLRRVALVPTDVSEELSASFIKVTKISELGITLAVTNNRRTLRIPSSSETSILIRATRRNNPEDSTVHSHRRENLKSYNFTSVGFRLLNHLPQYIKVIPVLRKFKNDLISYLLSHSFYSIEEYLSPGTNTGSIQLYDIIR